MPAISNLEQYFDGAKHIEMEMWETIAYLLPLSNICREFFLPTDRTSS